MYLWECSGWKLNAVFCLLILNFLNCDYWITCKSVLLFYRILFFFPLNWGLNPVTWPLSYIPNPFLKFETESHQVAPTCLQLVIPLPQPAEYLGLLACTIVHSLDALVLNVDQVWDACWIFVLFCWEKSFLVWNALQFETEPLCHSCGFLSWLVRIFSPGVVAHVCNPATREAEKVEPRVQSQLQQKWGTQ